MVLKKWAVKSDILHLFDMILAASEKFSHMSARYYNLQGKTEDNSTVLNMIF